MILFIHYRRSFTAADIFFLQENSPCDRCSAAGVSCNPVMWSQPCPACLLVGHSECKFASRRSYIEYMKEYRIFRSDGALPFNKPVAI